MGNVRDARCQGAIPKSRHYFNTIDYLDELAQFQYKLVQALLLDYGIHIASQSHDLVHCIYTQN